MLLDVTQYSDYNIATALRGPDASEEAGADLVKTVSTCVVRWLAGVVELSVSPDRACTVWKENSVQSRNAARQFWRKNGHFVSHIANALRSLLEPGVNHYYWLIAVMSREDESK